MQNDLISRSALIQMLKYNKEERTDESGETRQLIAVDINRMIEYVEKMPTAYNVDAVVEQLQNLQKDKYVLSPIICYALDKAIEIVRKGGVK